MSNQCVAHYTHYYCVMHLGCVLCSASQTTHCPQRRGVCDILLPRIGTIATLTVNGCVLQSICDPIAHTALLIAAQNQHNNTHTSRHQGAI